jgi:hypothetical protein
MTRTFMVALGLLLATAGPAWASTPEFLTPAGDLEAPYQVHALIGTLAQPATDAEGALSLRHADVWLDSRLFGDSSLRIKLDLLGMPSAFSQDTPWLKDAYVRTSWNGLDIRVGQFKLPLVTHGLEPAATLATIRRPAFNDGGLGFGNDREPGVLVGGHLGEPIQIETGLFAAYEGDHPFGEAIVRLSVAPVEHLKLSVSHLQGVAGVVVGSQQRTGFDAEVEAGPVTLSAEAIMGTDAHGQRAGWLGLAEWHFTPAWEAVAEIASWRPGEEDERELTLGLNWAPGPRLRVMGNFVHESRPQGTEDLALVAWRMML